MSVSSMRVRSLSFGLALLLAALLLSPLAAATVEPDKAYAASLTTASVSKKPGKTTLSKTQLVSNSKAKLSWIKTANAKKYQVYRSQNGGKFKLVKTTTSKSATVSLKQGCIYKFKIRAVNGKKKGTFSKVASLKTVSSAAPKVTATPSNAKITVSWPSVKNASGYLVYRHDADTSFSLVKNTTSLAFKDTGLALDTAYSYKVVPYVKNSGKQTNGTAGTASARTGKSACLLDVVTPYSKPYYYEDRRSSPFTMGGVSYKDGFTCMGYGGYGDDALGNATYFNLGGRYKTLSFMFGCVEENYWGGTHDGIVKVFTDGELALTTTRTITDLPKLCTVDVTHCSQLLISVYDNRDVAMYSSTWGLGNLMISV